MVPLQYGGGLGAAGVGAGVGLGQAEGADLLALGQRHQILLLLLLSAVGEDGPGAQGHVGRQNDAGAAVHPGQLLHGDGVAQHVQAGAAVLLGVGNPHQPQLTQFLDGLVWEGVVLVQLERDGFDLFFRKRADLGPQLFVGRCGLEQHDVTSFYARQKSSTLKEKEKTARSGGQHKLAQGVGTQLLVQLVLDLCQTAVDGAAAVGRPPRAGVLGVHAGAHLAALLHGLHQVVQGWSGSDRPSGGNRRRPPGGSPPARPWPAFSESCRQRPGGPAGFG